MLNKDTFQHLFMNKFLTKRHSGHTHHDAHPLSIQQYSTLKDTISKQFTAKMFHLRFKCLYQEQKPCIAINRNRKGFRTIATHIKVIMYQEITGLITQSNKFCHRFQMDSIVDTPEKEKMLIWVQILFLRTLHHMKTNQLFWESQNNLFLKLISMKIKLRKLQLFK